MNLEASEDESMKFLSAEDVKGNLGFHAQTGKL